MYLNVYEMNAWAAEGHPGNMQFTPETNPIKAFARRGEYRLTFPASHATSRFMSALSSFSLLGKLGDAVDFQNLPTSVQSPELARVFDALAIGDASESCGSPYEVANDPLTGHHYSRPGLWEHTYYNNNDKGGGYYGFAKQIHFEIAKSAADQLRQRAAHALVQIYVISIPSLAGYTTERYGEASLA